MEMYELECTRCRRELNGQVVDWQTYGKGTDPDNFLLAHICQNCNAVYCQKCIKIFKFGLISKWKKTTCPKCGKLFGPGFVLLTETPPVVETVPDVEWEIKSPTKIANRISWLIDQIYFATDPGNEGFPKGRWLLDSDKKEELEKLLKEHGNEYLNNQLSVLSGELHITPEDEVSLTLGNALTQLFSGKPLFNNASRLEKILRLGITSFLDDRELDFENKLIGTIETNFKYYFETKRDQPCYKVDDENNPMIFMCAILVAYESATKNGKAVPTMIKILKNQYSPYCSVKAARMLGEIRWDHRIIDALIDALEDHRVYYLSPSTSLFVLPRKGGTVSLSALISLKDIGNKKGLDAVARMKR